MGQQHAQIAVSLFRDSPQFAGTTGRVLFRGQTEPTGKMPGIIEVLDMTTGGGHHGRGGQQPDAGNGHQQGTSRTLPGDITQCLFQLFNPRVIEIVPVDVGGRVFKVLLIFDVRACHAAPSLLNAKSYQYSER